jgi:hypothetical protein
MEYSNVNIAFDKSQQGIIILLKTGPAIGGGRYSQFPQTLRKGIKTSRSTDPKQPRR